MILKLFVLFTAVLLFSGAVTYVIVFEGFLVALGVAVIGGAALTTLTLGLFHYGSYDWI